MARPGRRTLRALDAVAYAVALTALVALVGVAIGSLRNNGLVAAEYLLFWTAFLVMAMGAWKLRPLPAWKDPDDARLAAEPKRDTPFQRAVRRLPPLSRYELARGEQATDGAKLLLSSLVMLLAHVALSFV